jgi:RHS repeat-associated protein
MKPNPSRFSSSAKMLLCSFSAFALACLLPQQSGADEQTSKKVLNPTPDLCCDCITFTVQDSTDYPGNQQNTPALSFDGDRTVTVTIKHNGGENCDDTISGRVTAEAMLNSTGVKSKPFNVPSGGTVAVTFTISATEVRISNDWEFLLYCGEETSYCARDELTLNDCESCTSGTCAVSADSTSSSSGSFKASFPLASSKGGMSRGKLIYYTTDFSYAGRAGLFANVPAHFQVTRDGAGLITKVETGTSTIDVADVTGEQAFTVVNRDLAGDIYRTSKMSLVNEGGVDRLRLDSTFDNTTRRNEQTEPQPGTLVMERGEVVGGTFKSLERDTLTIDSSTPGVEIRRRITESRASASAAWSVVSDIKSKWENQTYGWVKTRQIVDPTGKALVSTWDYYQPGELTGAGGSSKGTARLKHHVRHDGYEAFYTYELNKTVVTTPYAGDPVGKTTTTSWNPGTKTSTVTTTVGTETLSKTVTAYTETSETRSVYTATGESLTTTTHYKLSGQDFGGRPEKVLHPDNTLTTYAYTRLAGDGYRTVTDRGATTDNNTVSQGARTTTVTNSRGTVILSKTEAIGHSTGSALFGSMAVTSVDNLGRPLVIAHHPDTLSEAGEQATASNESWTTTLAYNCCGISEQTDKYGIKTRYAYDYLQRRIKANRIGVTIETVRNGLTTDTHRYAKTVSGTLSSTLAGTGANLVSRGVRDLAGTVRESWTPNPTSAANGAIVRSSKVETTYLNPVGTPPATLPAGIGMRSLATSADSFTQTTDSFLDGRTANTSGDLSPAMAYSYSVNVTGEVTTRSYDDGGTLRETVSTQADWAGRTIRTDHMDGAFATNEYNALGQMVKSTDPDGVVTLMDYDEEGKRVVTALDLDVNGTINYGTDQVSSSETDPALDGTDPVWKTTSKVWQPGDGENDFTTVNTTLSSPDGLSSKSQRLGVSDPATSETTLNGSGAWSVKTTLPDNSYTVVSYAGGLMDITENFDANNVLITSSSVRDASDTTGSGYDTLNRPVAQRDSRTGVSTTTYKSSTCDLVGSVADPGSRTTAFTYDARGRRTAVDAPDTLDADGVTLTNITTTAYFPNNTVDENAGGQTYRRTYTYDYAQRQKTLTTYGTTTATTEWVYSTTRGFLTEKNYHGETGNGPGNAADYTYTAAGRLATRTWERGVTTTYHYDDGGRQTKVTYSDTTPQLDYILDCLGRPRFVIQGSQVDTWTVNVTEYIYRTNNLTLEKEITVEGPYLSTANTSQYTSTQDFKRTLDRSFDGYVRPTGWTLNSTEHSVAYDYRANDSRLNAVTGNSQTHTYGYEANTYGLIKTITSPAHTVTNTYEADRNVLTKKENKNGATDLATVNYTVNDINQRTAATHSGTNNNGAATRAFGYNATGENVSTATDNTAFDRYFNYDGIGNRNESRLGTSTATGGIATNYTADAQNSYTAIGALNPIKDADGNMTSGPLPVAPTANSTLAWDAENRLISVTVSGTTTTYGYDHQSRRIRKATGAAVTRFIYDGWNMIAEYAGSTLKRSYTWGMDLSGLMQGAGGVGGLLSITEASGNGSVKAGQTLYPTYDGNGNITRILDSSSNVVCSYGYDPFGNFENPTGNDADSSGYDAEQPFAFSTKYRDSETGLYYYGYRYYDPVTGRWPSRDPIEEGGGMNLYGMVRNNTINRWDRLGLEINKGSWNEVAAKSLGGNNYELKITAKSYIAGINGNITHKGDRPPVNFWALYWAAYKTDADYSENPPNDDVGGEDFRLYTNKTIKWCCEGNKLVNASKTSTDTAFGKEFIDFANYTHEIQADGKLYDDHFQADEAGIYGSIGVYGKPALFPNIGLWIVEPRADSRIWHNSEYDIRCINGKPKVNVKITGSVFPSHRLWANGVEADTLDQGPFISLFELEAPGGVHGF